MRKRLQFDCSLVGCVVYGAKVVHWKGITRRRRCFYALRLEKVLFSVETIGRMLNKKFSKIYLL